METVSHSSFRELRQAAGYKTVAALREDLDARNLHLPTTTIYRLDGGGRPESWERLCLIADFFNISPAKAATDFWHETDGDPCPRAHGCNGVLRLPSEPTAEHLEVELTCTGCGTKKRERISDHHSQLCWTCYTRNSGATPLGQLLKSFDLTVAGFAEELGLPLRTVTGWVLGEHPPENWECVRILARRFDVPEEQAPETFWNQKVDAQCPKHDWCRGRTTLPIDGKAQFLDIMIRCQDCGTPKYYRGETRYQHHDQLRCHDCGIKARGKPRKPGPAVLPKDPSRVATVKCGGYNPNPYAKRTPELVHVDSCPRETKKPRRRLRFIKQHGPTGWISKQCLIAGRGVPERENRLGDVLTAAAKAYMRSSSREAKDYFAKTTGFECDKSVPKVKSLPQLNRRQKVCHQLWSHIINSDDGKLLRLLDEELQKLPRAQQMDEPLTVDHLLGSVCITGPNGRERDQARKEALKRKRIPAEMRHVAGGLVRRWTPKSTGKLVPEDYWKLYKTNATRAQAQELLGGKNFVAMKINGEWLICKLPATVQLCEFCHTVDFDVRTAVANGHPKCRHEGTILPDPHARGGRSFSLAGLTKHLSWMICNKMGSKGYGTIANEFGVREKNVKKEISSIMDLRPEPKKVRPRFFKMASLLWSIQG